MDDFFNPFDNHLKPDKLYNLSSGIPVSDEVADGILKNDETSFKEFDHDRQFSCKTNFF